MHVAPDSRASTTRSRRTSRRSKLHAASPSSSPRPKTRRSSRRSQRTRREPLQLGSPAQTARAEREKLATTIVGLEKGLVALKSDRAAAAGEQAARDLADCTVEARGLTQQEGEKRTAAGKAFSSFVDSWNDLAEVLNARSDLLGRVAGEGLVDAVGVFDRKTISAWEASAGYIVEPVPVSLRSFIEEMLEATTGDRTDVEAEFAAVDELNARRRAIAATNPGGDTDLLLLATR